MANLSFGCSQQDLYAAGRIFWQSYQDNWEDFAEYSPIYTEDFAVEKLAALNAAERLLDKPARDAIATAVLRELEAASKEFLYNYQLFKSYVLRIYDPSVHDLKLAAIGDGYFAKASTGSWSNVSALISQTVPFVEDNSVELMSKNIMPISFLPKLTASAQAFNTKYPEYTAAVKNVANATAEKAAANSAVYEAIAEVAKTAVVIFKKDPATAKLFSWAAVVSKVHGIRPAGVNGKCVIEGTKTALSDVTIRIKGTDKVVVTDKNGRYEISPLSVGTYTLLIEKDGYETMSIEFKVNAGVVSRVNMGLVAQAAA